MSNHLNALQHPVSEIKKILFGDKFKENELSLGSGQFFANHKCFKFLFQVIFPKHTSHHQRHLSCGDQQFRTQRPAATTAATTAANCHQFTDKRRSSVVIILSPKTAEQSNNISTSVRFLQNSKRHNKRRFSAAKCHQFRDNTMPPKTGTALKDSRVARLHIHRDIIKHDLQLPNVISSETKDILQLQYYCLQRQQGRMTAFSQRHHQRRSSDAKCHQFRYKRHSSVAILLPPKTTRQSDRIMHIAKPNVII